MNVGLTDPSVDFNSLDIFTNAENSFKDKPRVQNLFVHVTSKESGKPVKFILYEIGTGGFGGHTTGIYFSIVIPYSDTERIQRINSAIEAFKVSKNDNSFQIPEDLSMVDFFNMYEVNESKPGEYFVSVDYLSPAGKVSSTPFEIQITDNGNLYLKVLQSFKPDA